MAAIAGKRDKASRRIADFENPPGRAEATLRRAGFWLWIVAAIIEALLITRFIFMWVYGVNATGGASSTIVTDFYWLTTPLVSPLTKSADVTLPPAGLSHVFDISCFLAIDIVFFSVLAITKLGIWAGRKWDERRERKPTAPEDLPRPAEPEIPADRVPVDSSAR